jgi:hypothetical protein
LRVLRPIGRDHASLAGRARDAAGDGGPDLQIRIEGAKPVGDRRGIVLREVHQDEARCLRALDREYRINQRRDRNCDRDAAQDRWRGGAH